jgi:HEAT repeat protein
MRIKKQFMSDSFRSLLCSILIVASASVARAGIRPDFEMDRDPELHVPAKIDVFSSRLKPLWLEALKRPEADMQRMAADAIGRGHLAGVADMTDAVPRLVEIVIASETHPVARLAAAQALISLGAKVAAPQLAETSEHFGADLRQIVEPALAKWGYEPIRGVWLNRLTTPATRRRDLLLAIDGLAMAGDKSAVAALLEHVHDILRTPDVRSAAARAAALIQDQGLEGDAERLIAGPAPVPLLDRLCAVRLLARHSGEDSQKLLSQFALDAEPAVAIVALTRLIEVAAQRVVPIAETAMRNADPLVRQRGAEAYVLFPDARRVAVLAPLLDDPHPEVRGAVQDWLFELQHRPELADPVLSALTELLAGDGWRGVEQAALILGAVGHRPAAPRLVTLLESTRPEVGIAAAWALKRLALPETLPALLDKARRQTEIRSKGVGEIPGGIDQQTAHLIETFGLMKYAPAEPLLVQYIPKRYNFGMYSRSAAIWSLGHLHEGAPDESLARQLLARAIDDGPPSEFVPVRAMAAVSIGRMKALSPVPALQKYIGGKPPATSYGVAIRWALMEITGEFVPEPDPALAAKKKWFLEPLEGAAGE